jgi:hypothetical protein
MASICFWHDFDKFKEKFNVFVFSNKPQPKRMLRKASIYKKNSCLIKNGDKNRYFGNRLLAFKLDFSSCEFNSFSSVTTASSSQVSSASSPSNPLSPSVLLVGGLGTARRIRRLLGKSPSLSPGPPGLNGPRKKQARGGGPGITDGGMGTRRRSSGWAASISWRICWHSDTREMPMFWRTV